MENIKNIIIIAFLLIVVMIISACQPTPSKTAVINGNSLENEIAGSPAPFKAYEAPANWRETLDMKGGSPKTEIDASISVPDVKAFPVYSIKEVKFSDMLTESLVNSFTKNRDVYKIPEATKSELEAQIVIAKRNKDEETVSALEAMIKTAPETVEPQKITEWNPEKSPDGCFPDENGEYAEISFKPDTFRYENGRIFTESILEALGKGKIGDIAISEKDAVMSAQKTLNELDIDYMAVDSFEKAQRYALLSNSTYPEISEKPVSNGYMIKFVRNMEGINSIIDNCAVMIGMKNDYAYSAPLYPEEVRIYVDENGKVQSFAWFHPLSIVGKVTENAPLLSFDEIKQRVRDMLIYINSYGGLPTTVTRIEMGMAIVGVKDHPDEAMYIPAWFIYYTQTFQDPDTGKDEKQNLRLTLNAIDGGRVLEIPRDNDSETQ